MKRRNFLKYGMGLSVLGVSGCYKNTANSADSKISSDQQTMQKGSMHSTHHHGGHMHAMQGMRPRNLPRDLLPMDALPTGQPLTALPVLKNNSTQTGVFKTNLTVGEFSHEFAKGIETKCWGYNKQLPAPQIVVNEGDWVEITVNNQLEQPTTVHWHGLDVPPEQDGNPSDAIAPKNEHTYAFQIPLGSAGSYWYHPHPHGVVAEQLYMGLAGSLLVKPLNDPLANIPTQDWFITDVRLAPDGSIPNNTMVDVMNGREGEFILINGLHQPNIKIDGTERIKITNATSSRYLQLELEGFNFVVIGTDGGLLEKPLPATKSLLISPAKRFEVVLVKNNQSQVTKTGTLVSTYFDRKKMHARANKEPVSLATLDLLGSLPTQAALISNLPKTLRIIPELGNPTAHKKVVFGDMFIINGQTFDANRIDFLSKKDEVELWEIVNHSTMHHPFHIHGAQFEVVAFTDDQGKKKSVNHRSLQDTINLKPNQTIWFKFKQKHLGMRMFHCHIFEHEQMGMMGQVKVV